MLRKAVQYCAVKLMSCEDGEAAAMEEDIAARRSDDASVDIADVLPRERNYYMFTLRKEVEVLKQSGAPRVYDKPKR